MRGVQTINRLQTDKQEIKLPLRFRFMFAPALLLCLNLVLFGTFAIFSGNPGEFLVTYPDTLNLLLPPALGLTFAVTLLALLPGTGGREILNAVLMFLAVVTYIHGNLLYWNTGVLDGSALDLSQSWRNLADVLLWVSLAWLAWRFRQWLTVHGWQICAVLFVFQSIGLAVQAGKLREPSLDMPDMPVDLNRFSIENNIIHIILDGFQASIFEHILSTEPVLSNELEGFTFFRDAVTPSDITYLSVPATLSGTAFSNDITISQYHERTLGGDNLYRFLANRGYAIDVATPLWWNKSSDVFSSYYRVPTPYANRDEALHSTGLLLLDISLFRQVPHFLKASVYRDGAWLLSNKFVRRPEQQFHHFAHNDFLRDFTSRVALEPERPSYKFLHLVTPHAPLVSNADCTFTGKELDYSLETFSDQSRCTLHTVVEFLRRLKELGIYQKSLLMIHGDHGGGVAFGMRDSNGQHTDSGRAPYTFWGNPLPLVLIKPAHAKGPLRVSDRPVTLTDIPATVASLLESDHGFPGQSMFAEENGVPRIRDYFRSTIHRNEAAAKDRFDDFSHFTIQGSVYDVAAWTEADYYRAPAMNESGSYAWGTTLSFGARGNFKPFQNGGWTITQSEAITWTEGGKSGLSIPFPASEQDIRMTARLKPLLEAGKLDRQRVTVVVSGHEVAHFELRQNTFQVFELVIPAEYIDSTGNTLIEFLLPDARSPASLQKGPDIRALGIAFASLQFDPISE